MKDFTLCAEICLDKKESLAKARLCTHPVFSSVVSIWSKFKRDLQSVSPLPVEILVRSAFLFEKEFRIFIILFTQDVSFVDLLDRSGTIIKPKIAWELLHEEFNAIDHRKLYVVGTS